MIQFLRSLPRHFSTGWKSLVRHASLTFSSITAVTVTLLIVGLLVLVAANISSFTRNIEKDFQIQATISPGSAGKATIEALQKTIEQMDGVKRVTFSSKEDELQKLIEENGEMFQYYEGEDRNPLYDIFSIELSDNKAIDAVTEKLKATEGIVDATYGGDGISVMVNVFEVIRNGGALFVLFLGLLAVLLIKNTIKMTIQTRHEELAIMRNVGASNWYIRTPFVVEGMYIGLLGSILPLAVVAGGYYLVYEGMGGVFLSSMFVMKPFWPFAAEVCGVILLIGILVGMVGSFLAVSKYLRWKR